MENNIKVRHNPHSRHRAHLKKKLKYNDSISKYKNTIPLIQKQNINPTQEQSTSKMDLKHLREGFMESNTEIKKEVPSIYLSNANFDGTKRYKSPFSVQKHQVLRDSTLKRNYARKEYNRNLTPNNLNNICINDSLYKERDRSNKKNDILSSSYKNNFRPKSRPNSRSPYNNKELPLNLKRNNLHDDDSLNNLQISNTFAGKSIKGREFSTQNILQKENKELRQKVREMTFKINELLNQLNSMKIYNQRTEIEKKKLSMKITNLENKLNFNRDMTLKELEIKTNTKSQINEEIFNLSTVLDKKEKPIVGFSNYMENYNDYDEIGENNVNERKNLYKTQTYNDERNYKDDDELKRLSNNELIDQIYKLREDIKKLKFEKENKTMNNNLLDSDDRLVESKKRIIKLIEENKNITNANRKLKIESQKMKNYYMSHFREQKKFIENQQNEYQNNLNNLGFELNILKDENNALKNEIGNVSTNNLPKNQDMNDNDNENKNNHLLIQLIEENNMLKAKLNEKEQKLNNNNYNEDNNNVNLLRKINYLNKDLEEKNKEINNLQEKLKNLINQLNTFKNNKEDLMNNNTQLEQEVNQLNIKINKLENINFNKDQQIKDLSNLNNKLSIQVNDVHNSNCQQIFNNNDLNHNEELEQKISLLERKNEELQKKLMNNLNNGKKNNKNINQILHDKNNLLKENFNLKEEILSLKNSITLNLQRIDELERQLEEAQNECEIKLNELKLKQNEIKKLSNIIEKKEKEIEFESNYEGRESGSLGMGDKNNIQLSQEIEEKNKKIVNLKKEINNFKSKNNKLFLENSSLKEKMEIIQNEHDETLDKFKNELNDKNLKIQKLTKENNYLKNSANNNYEVEREIDLNNIKNENNSLRNIVNSTRINDSNRIKFLKDELEEYIIINESHRIQIKTLKEEIKMMKDKIKDLETFGGKMKNIDEFFSLLNQALYNYIPKKKEQKEALNKIMEVLNNSQKQK